MGKKYGYMIKTVGEKLINGRWRLVGYGNFIYPRKKGAKIIVEDWNTHPYCSGGIFGIVHETRYHNIFNRPWWIILRYRIGTEIQVEKSKIKVPYAWMVDWDKSAEKIQRRFGELTRKPYVYDYAVQTTKNGAIGVTQQAGSYAEQSAEHYAVQAAESNSSQKGLHYVVQIAGRESEQSASYSVVQAAAANSTQFATDEATQIGGFNCRQISGVDSLQTAWNGSYQTAGKGSVSIVRGKRCYCKHTGEVLQILIYNHQFYSTIINDRKKHELEIVDGELVDTIIEDSEEK